MFKNTNPYFLSIIVLVTSFLCFSLSCRQKEKASKQISFYYWKTTYAPSPFELKYLEDQKVNRIYLHCFDIVAENELPLPQGVLIWKQKPLSSIEYIPVVFIENKVFIESSTAGLDSLCDKMLHLCKQIFSDQDLKVNEIQIDCDWTASSKENYFHFLQRVKKNGLIVSNTLRLYQYKYRKESGIAPTDFATLMCYNMGSMKDAKAGNSILNQNDLQAYLKGQPLYPVPMNVALPIFNWTLLYKGHHFEGILYKIPQTENGNWKKVNDGVYVCSRDYFDISCERIFYAGEQIRVENISPQQLSDAKKTIHQYVDNTKNEIIYFDLDSAKLQRTLP